MHLEQTLPCMAQKSGFMSGSSLESSGNPIFSAMQASTSVAQQLTIICTCTGQPQPWQTKLTPGNITGSSSAPVEPALALVQKSVFSMVQAVFLLRRIVRQP